jgi:hypothetical protein
MDPLDPVVRSFVQRQRIPASAIRSGGRVVFTVDGRHRVTICGGSHYRLVLLADLLPLVDQAAEGQLDAVLLRLSRMATALLKDHAQTLCIDRTRQVLLLQHVVAAGADLAALEGALTEFANSLSFWKEVCRADIAAMAGVPT